MKIELDTAVAAGFVCIVWLDEDQTVRVDFSFGFIQQQQGVEANCAKKARLNQI